MPRKVTGSLQPEAPKTQ